MKLNITRQLSRRERRLKNRIDKANWSGQSPMIAPPAIHYELADRIQATNAGGLGVIQQMVKQLELAESINRNCPIFKMHLPYSEADHVLNIAYNLLAGGTCLEHLELRRKDEAYLNALGAERIPDPTTAGACTCIRSTMNISGITRTTTIHRNYRRGRKIIRRITQISPMTRAKRTR